MIQRPPLNALQPRTVRETERNAFDWMEGPHKAFRVGFPGEWLLYAVALAATVIVSAWIGR
jgi:hypothetical protein